MLEITYINHYQNLEFPFFSFSKVLYEIIVEKTYVITLLMKV